MATIKASIFNDRLPVLTHRKKRKVKISKSKRQRTLSARLKCCLWFRKLVHSLQEESDVVELMRDF